MRPWDISEPAEKNITSYTFMAACCRRCSLLSPSSGSSSSGPPSRHKRVLCPNLIRSPTLQAAAQALQRGLAGTALCAAGCTLCRFVGAVSKHHKPRLEAMPSSDCIKQTMQGDHCTVSLGQQQMPRSTSREQMWLQASTSVEHSLGRPDGGKHLGLEALLVHEGAMGAATVVQE